MSSLRADLPAYAIEARRSGSRIRYLAKARWEGIEPEQAEAGTLGELRQQLEGQQGSGAPLDPGAPSSARLYDYLLGGKNNFEADRLAAERIMDRYPTVRDQAVANKQFLAAAVRWVAARQGIGQFVDLGAGFPPLVPGSPSAWEQVHCAAGEGSRVVYADHDPMVVAHLRALAVKDVPGADAIVADLRDPDAVWANPALRTLINPRRPVCLVFGSVLHYLPVEEAVAVTAEYAARLAPGSHVVFSIGRDFTAGQEAYNYTGGPAVHLYSLADIRRLFGGLELLPPGLANITRWRPEWDDPALTAGETMLYAGVARRLES